MSGLLLGMGLGTLVQVLSMRSEVVFCTACSVHLKRVLLYPLQFL